MVLDHQPARPCLVSCGGDWKRRSRLVLLALPGRSSHRPSPRARPPRASRSFGGSSPFMPRATHATMRGNCSWRSRPRRRSQSLATVRLARLGRCHLSSHVPCRDTRFLSFAGGGSLRLENGSAGTSKVQSTTTLHRPSDAPLTYARNSVSPSWALCELVRELCVSSA